MTVELELGKTTKNVNSNSSRLEKSILKKVRARCVALAKKNRPRVLAFGQDDSSDSSSDGEAEDFDLDLLRQNGAQPWNILDTKEIAIQCISELAVPLEEDPEDSGEENLWGSNPVPIISLRPGERFSYLYFAWDFDRNGIWDIENFYEARSITVPEAIRSQRGNYFICRSVAVHQKGTRLELESVFRPITSSSSDPEEIHTDSDSDTGRSDTF